MSEPQERTSSATAGGDVVDTGLAGAEAMPPSPTVAPGRRKQLSLLLKVMTFLIAVAALAFCVIALVKEWHRLSTALSHANWGLLVLGLVLGGAGMGSLAMLWRALIQDFGGGRVRPLDALSWFFAGEMGKYVPGGLWPVLGRGELARRAGVGRSVAYTTVLLSLGYMCVGAAVVCAFLLPFVAGQRNISWEWLLLLLIPLGVIGVHPAVLGRIFRLMARVTKGRYIVTVLSWPRMLRFILFAIPAWIFVGASALCVTAALHLHFSVAAIALAAVSGWIIGFLALPVPAGAGIRELIFISVSGLGGSTAVVVATVFRFVFIVVDLAGGISGLVAIRLHRQRPARSAPVTS